MRQYLRAMILLSVAGMSAGGFADICKWVDDDGVTHYAESCPENVDGSAVATDPVPSPSMVEDAVRRSEEMHAERSSRRESREAEKALQQQDRRVRVEQRKDLRHQCLDASRNLMLLRTPAPVYVDDANQLHLARTLHDSWYAGQRTWLDDTQRAAEISHFERVREQTCVEGDQPDMTEILAYFDERDRRACANLQDKLDLLRKAGPEADAEKVASLENSLSRYCD